MDAETSGGGVAIGLMSGTSCDGVDAVALRLQDVRRPHHPEVLGHVHLPFDAALRARLLAPEKLTVADLSRLHYGLPRWYARAVTQLPGWRSARVVGMHGQTVWHEPPSRLNRTRTDAPANTLQIGSAAALAQALALPVVGDLRGADIARGGEGAPIVPYAHWFFSGGEPGLMVVNLGGIANATFVRETAAAVEAADLGPGMMLADALSRFQTDDALDCDRDGCLSQAGTIHPRVVAHITSHPFFSRPLPRTTGREDFGVDYARDLQTRFADLPDADLLRSVLSATAEIVAGAARAATRPVERILLTGGGAYNPTLFDLLSQAAAPIRVERAGDGVFAPSIHEPAAVALIAARTLAGLPSSLARVTGARDAAVLGHVHV